MYAIDLLSGLSRCASVLVADIFRAALPTDRFTQGPWALRSMLPVVNMSNNRLPTLLVSTTQHEVSLVVLTAQEVLAASAAAQLLEQTRFWVEQAVRV